MNRILIVDDDAQNVDMLRALLVGSGYEVALASNGVEALQQARTQAPDLVISDILMPVMDGFELCSAWRTDEGLQAVPFVFYTATYTDPSDEDFALSLGADTFLVKPQEPAALLSVVDELLSLGERRAVAPRLAADEVSFFRRHSQTLIRKLEQKVAQTQAEILARKQTEAELRESEQRHRGLFESMLQGVIYQDTDGLVSDANPAAQRMLGLTLEQMRGKSTTSPGWVAVDAEGRPFDPECYPSAVSLRTGQPVAGVILGLQDPRTHATRWFSVSSTPLVRPGESAPYQVCTSLHDVTEHRQLDTERRLTNTVLETLSSPHGRDDVVRAILSAIREFTGVGAAGLRLREGDDYPYAATAGFPEEFVRQENSLLGRGPGGTPSRGPNGDCVLDCLCGRVIQGSPGAAAAFFSPGGSFWTNDAAATAEALGPRQPGDRQRCFRFGFSSIALVPLRWGAETLGLLQLCDPRPGLFTDRMLRYLERLGTTIGIALARRRAEAALRESEELFRRVVQDQTEMICRSLPDGTVTFVNDAYARFEGRPVEELVGRRLSDFIPSEVRAKVEADIRSLTPEHPVSVLELPVLNGATPARWVRWTNRGFFDEAGRLTAVQATGSDISASRMAEEQHRLAAVGQLAAGVAHDFNNLLQAMGLTAQMVAMGRVAPQRLIDIVVNSTRSGSEITRNLMAFARPDEPQREAGRIEEALDSALAVAARQLADGEIRVVRQYPPGYHPVVFDRAQMEQVYLNLIINASHAMREGGTLTVTTAYEAATAVVVIADTGTGIAPENLDRIFEPFFTTKGRLGESEIAGSGLGLSVSHGLVTAHGGTISVTSTPGVGTTFEIRLPLGEPPATPAEAAPAPSPLLADMSRLRGLRALVAEDEDEILAVLRQVFSVAGCELHAVATAAEAIEAISSQQRFDVVLSDLMMPGGGGRAVVEFCRTLGPEAPPVVIMSGRLERALHDEVTALGAARTIEKPFDVGELFGLLADLLAPESA